MKKIRAALAQINPTVGDIDGNTEKIISFIKRAVKKKADIVVFPEMSVTGYPPEDLLMKRHFIKDNMDALKTIEKASGGIAVVVGFVDFDEVLYNGAAVIADGKIYDVYHKKHLPNYGVFDEYRYFSPGRRYPVYDFSGIKVGVNICEDIWIENGPAKVQALKGAELILNINASPYHVGKSLSRKEWIRELAVECNSAIVYLNMVGGQDELVFDGGSFAFGADGDVLATAGQFSEEMLCVDIPVKGKGRRMTRKKKEYLESVIRSDEYTETVEVSCMFAGGGRPGIKKKRSRVLAPEEEVYGALVLGTRDYVCKSGFRDVVVGMSGGIDSALTATIAVDALGKENVHGLFMPSVYTSRESLEDAGGHAGNLGIEFTVIPIDDIFKAYKKTFFSCFKGKKTDITEENIQARIRGNILMAFSNKFGWIVLTTGNKSEMSVGYATLYGDMAGGFAVIKDVPKTVVYKLSEWRNGKEGKELIPGRILRKEPTAELKPDQKDSDTLPPYPLLDPILRAYVEEDKGFEEILEMGCEEECVKRVISMIDHSEYKRRQAPPGVKITPRSFGKDRRFPITNRYKNF